MLRTRQWRFVPQSIDGNSNPALWHRFWQERFTLRSARFRSEIARVVSFGIGFFGITRLTGCTIGIQQVLEQIGQEI